MHTPCMDTARHVIASLRLTINREKKADEKNMPAKFQEMFPSRLYQNGISNTVNSDKKLKFHCMQIQIIFFFAFLSGS